MVIVEKQAKSASGRNAVRYATSVASYMATARANTLAEEYGVTLASYMHREVGAAPEKTEKTRVLAAGARLEGGAVDWDAGLVALNERLAKRSSRVKRPARHIIASYRDGEQPDESDCDQVVETLLEELQCGDGVALWALHGDTDNAHLHVLVLTLDSDGGSTPFGPGGRSHEAMQRAIARVEHAQQLTPERGSRYVAGQAGVRPRTVALPPVKRRAPIRTEILQWEEEIGLESFTRYAQTVLAEPIERASSWAEAQAALAPLGAAIWKHGSGGEIRSGDGEHKVKLSSVDRSLAWRDLTARFGEWSEPVTDPAPYVPRVADPMRAKAWLERDLAREAVHARVQARVDRLRSEQAIASGQIEAEFDARLSDIGTLAASADVAGRFRQTLRSMRAGQLAAVQTAYADRIAAVRELRDEADDAPDLGGVDLEAIGAPDCSLQISWARPGRGLVDLPGYRAVRIGEAVKYWSEEDDALRPAFVERGNRIWIHDRSDAAVRTALLLARARYGDVRASGEKGFIRQARRLGEELGIEVQAGVEGKKAPVRPRSPRIARQRAAVREALRSVAPARAGRGSQDRDAQRLPPRPSATDHGIEAEATRATRRPPDPSRSM